MTRRGACNPALRRSSGGQTIALRSLVRRKAPGLPDACRNGPAQAGQGFTALGQVGAIGVELVIHLRPDIEANAAALGGDQAREIADHVDQDFPPTGLQVDRPERAIVLTDRRQGGIAQRLPALEPLCELQGHVALHHIVRVVAELAGAAPPDIGPRADAHGECRFRQIGFPQLRQHHQRQVAAGRVAAQHQFFRRGAVGQHMGVGGKPVLQLGGMRVLGRQAVVGRENRHPERLRQTGREVARHAGVEGVAAAVKVQQGGIAVARLRQEPGATRLAVTGFAYAHVGIGFGHAVDAVEVGPAFGNVMADTKGMIELGSRIARAVFEQKRPHFHQWPAQCPSQRHTAQTGGGYGHAAQLVRQAALNYRLHDELLADVDPCHPARSASASLERKRHPLKTPLSRLHIPSPALGACLLAGIERDTRGCSLGDLERLNYYPATPMAVISWIFEGTLHLVEGEAQGNRVALGPPLPRLTLSGPQRGPVASWSPGPVHALSVGIYPEAFKRLIGHPVESYRDRHLPLEAVAPPALLQACQAVLAAGAPAPFALLEKEIRPLWKEPLRPSPAPYIGDWVRSVATRATHSSAGRSLRHWQRLVRDWTGQSYRDLQLFIRVEEAFIHRVAVRNGGTPNLADIAADAGFADQSHMGREIRRITGVSPARFGERLANDESFWYYRLIAGEIRQYG